MNIVIKQFWMTGTWTPPTTLSWKVLRDISIGWKEFKPPEWQEFAP
jgi:hypothetical protein